jgi:hypothetical protein
LCRRTGKHEAGYRAALTPSATAQNTDGSLWSCVHVSRAIAAVSRRSTGNRQDGRLEPTECAADARITSGGGALARSRICIAKDCNEVAPKDWKESGWIWGTTKHKCRCSPHRRELGLRACAVQTCRKPAPENWKELGWKSGWDAQTCRRPDHNRSGIPKLRYIASLCSLCIILSVRLLSLE